MASLQNNLKLSESDYINFLEISLKTKNLYNAAICYNDLGNIFLNKKNYKKAVRFYNKALRLNQINHIVLNNLGTAYRELDKIEKSVGYYQKSLKIKPDYDLAHLNLEFSLMQICDWDLLKKYNFSDYAKTPFMSVITEDNPQRNLQVAQKWI